MNKDALKKRMTDLAAAQMQAAAQANTLMGQIQECTYWLQLIEKEQEENKPHADNVQ